MLRTLRVEREALAANIATERESVTAAFDSAPESPRTLHKSRPERSIHPETFRYDDRV
jgi:hypothetical protein